MSLCTTGTGAKKNYLCPWQASGIYLMKILLSDSNCPPPRFLSALSKTNFFVVLVELKSCTVILVGDSRGNGNSVITDSGGYVIVITGGVKGDRSAGMLANRRM